MEEQPTNLIRGPQRTAGDTEPSNVGSCLSLQSSHHRNLELDSEFDVEPVERNQDQCQLRLFGGAGREQGCSAEAGEGGVM